MKLVIEIDEEDYKEVREDTYSGTPFENRVFSVIANGIPLPKGHGRLIDADTLEYTCNSDECGMLTGCNHCQYNIITEDEIDNAPTIIEADKESE